MHLKAHSVCHYLIERYELLGASFDVKNLIKSQASTSQASTSKASTSKASTSGSESFESNTFNSYYNDFEESEEQPRDSEHERIDTPLPKSAAPGKSVAATGKSAAPRKPVAATGKSTTTGKSEMMSGLNVKAAVDIGSSFVRSLVKGTGE